VTLNQAAITLNKVMSPTIYGNWKVTQISGGIGNTEQYPTGLTELYNFTNQYIRTDTSLSQPYLANFTLTRGRSIFSSDSVDIVDYHDDMNIINREYSFKTLDTLIMSDHAFDGFYYKMFRANN
jgi:hypothetical protein